MKFASVDLSASTRLAVLKAKIIEHVPMIEALDWAKFKGVEVEHAEEFLGNWRIQGEVLAVQHAGSWHYPQFQFDDKANPSPHIAGLIKAVGVEAAGWSLLSWLDAHNLLLKGLRPIEVFQENPAAVLSAAQAFYCRED